MRASRGRTLKQRMPVKNFVGDSSYAATISSLISKYLEPRQHRIDREKLKDYRQYVRDTGRIN